MLVIILMSLCLTTAETKNTTFLLTVTNESSQVLLAVDQTLEEIDNNILTSATIDTECNVTRALKEFYDYVTTDSSTVAVIGCGCTPVTESIAKISWLWNVPVISCVSSTLVLSDRSMYPSFYRTVPSDEVLVSAMATIMNCSEWRQLTIITEEQPQFLELEYRISQMTQNSVNISKGVHFHTDIISQNYTTLAEKISHVFNYQPHIYLPLASDKAKVYILCSAYQKGRFYPNYAWILLGQHEADWWKEHYKETNCTAAEIEKALNRSFVLTPSPDDDLHDYTNVSSYASDAVRALAEVLKTCNETGAGLNNSCTGDNLNWNVTFRGSTGIVRFNQTNGDREATSTVLQQYQYRKIQTLGLIQKCDELQLIDNSTIWPDGRPPDGTPQVVLHSVSIETTVLNFTLGGITIVSVIICLLFNIIFRERKIVKLISPKLNYILLLGVILMACSTLAYPSTIFYLIATFCTTDRLFASLGYDLVIGIALVKTCRVYYIFKRTSPGKKPPQDWQLLLLVLLIAVIEILFAVPLLVLGLVNGDVAETRSTEIMPAFNEQGVLENFSAINCGLSIYLPIFLFVSIGYKLILHIIALVFALLTRKVKIEVLNDSRETAAIIYASTILLIITCLVIFALGETVNLLNIMWTLIIFSVSMVHLGLTFIPKMIALYKDPHGTKVFNSKDETTTTPLSTHSTNISGSNLTGTATANNEIVILQDKLSQMEKKLQQYEEAEENRRNS